MILFKGPLLNVALHGKKLGLLVTECLWQLFWFFWPFFLLHLNYQNEHIFVFLEHHKRQSLSNAVIIEHSRVGTHSFHIGERDQPSQQAKVTTRQWKRRMSTFGQIYLFKSHFHLKGSFYILKFIIAYKDDFSYTSEDNLHESSNDKVNTKLFFCFVLFFIIMLIAFANKQINSIIL